MGKQLAAVFQGYLLFLFFWNNTRIACFRSAPAAGAPTEGGAPQQPPNLTSNRRLQQTQAQVDEVSVYSIQLVKHTEGAHAAIVILGIFASFMLPNTLSDWIIVCLTLFCISFHRWWISCV